MPNWFGSYLYLTGSFSSCSGKRRQCFIGVEDQEGGAAFSFHIDLGIYIDNPFVLEGISTGPLTDPGGLTSIGTLKGSVSTSLLLSYQNLDKIDNKDFFG